jgi:hypothetical protein
MPVAPANIGETFPAAPVGEPCLGCRIEKAILESRNHLMRYWVGRLLQLAGLIVLPAAIAGNLAEKLTLRQSLGLSALGMGIFSIGWMLQQGAKPS